MAYATVETVRDALDALTAEGIRPSIPKIRRRLGGGSHTTILRCLNEIRDESSAQAQSHGMACNDPNSLPDKIRTGLAEVSTAVTNLEKHIRVSLENEVAEQHRRLREAHQAEVAHLQQSIDDARTQTDGAARDTHEICEELDRVQSDLERARAELERLSTERDDLNKSASQMQEALCELEADRDAAHETVETARAAVDRAEAELSRVLVERQTAIAERDTAAAALEEVRTELRGTAERLATAEARVAAQASALKACGEERDQARRRCEHQQDLLRQADTARGSAEGQLEALQSAYNAERDAWHRERAALLNHLRPARRTPPRNASGAKSNT